MSELQFDADVLRARRMLDEMQATLTDSRRMIEETQRQCDATRGASASIDAQWKTIQEKFSLMMSTAIGQLSTAFAAQPEPVPAVEKLDGQERVEQSAAVLAAKIRAAKGKAIVFTGAGISTASGIVDYRSGVETNCPAGPGAWTLEAMEKEKPPAGPTPGARRNVERFDEAKPSFTHRAVAELVRRGLFFGEPQRGPGVCRFGLF
jgi:hypothetical protein